MKNSLESLKGLLNNGKVAGFAIPVTNHLQKLYTLHSLDMLCLFLHRALQNCRHHTLLSLFIHFSNIPEFIINTYTLHTCACILTINATYKLYVKTKQVSLKAG